MDIGIEIRAEGTKKYLYDLEKNIPITMRNAMDKVVTAGIAEIRRNYVKADLHQRTHTLFNSFNKGDGSSVKGAGKNTIGIIGTNVFYSLIHEYGKTIYAKPGGFLCWKNPIYTNIAQTRFLKDASKMQARAEKMGLSKKEIGGMYIFAKKVTIPARPFIRPTFNKIKGEAVRIFNNKFNTMLFENK